MVRDYRRKTNQQSWSEQSMTEAVAKVRDKSMSLGEAALTYDIPKTTLFRRVNKDGEPGHVSKKGLGRYKPVFTEKQEKDLADYISFMEIHLFGLTKRDFQRLIFQFAVRNGVEHPFNTKLEMAGEDFVYGFFKRHSKLSLPTPEATSAAGFITVVTMYQENMAIRSSQTMCHLRPHECKYCGRLFHDTDQYLSHVRHHKMKIRPHWYKISKEHGQNMHRREARHYKFRCQYCSKEFMKRFYFKKHVAHAHANYTCNICDKVLVGSSQFRRHEIMHRDKRPHICQHCKKGFKRISLLTEHQLTHATKPHTCQVCNKAFANASKLKRHELIHSDDRPHVCQNCQKSFKLLYNLREHELIHAEKPHKCTMCNKTFATLRRLHSHEVNHGGMSGPHVCRYCKKGFKRGASLKEHELGHIRMPNRCKICSKDFVSPSKLRRHELIHSEKRPHICQHCNKGFKLSSHLKEHLRTHTREKPFRCQTCDNSFAQSSTLKGHQRHCKERAEMPIFEMERTAKGRIIFKVCKSSP